MRLAREARIRTPVAQLVERGGHRHSVLVMDRFDRAEDGTRIGYVSAATLLEHPFGSGPGPDYRTFAEDLAGSSADPERDAHELFRRVAFTLLVRNTDDHLRNHGMVRAAAGWRLSPAFDVNPQRLTAPSLSPTPLTPDDAGGADRDVRLLLDSAGSYRLTRDAAVQILTEVERATSGWVRAARAHGVAEDEIAPWARAFDNPNRQRVRDLPLLASAPAPSRGRRSPLRDGRGGLPPRDSRGRFVGAPPRDTGDTSARDDA